MTTQTHASAPALAAHTPGPWSLDGIQNNSAATTSIIIRSSGNASHGRAPYIAEISWPRDGLRRAESAITDEDWANARLIAASPDLAEQCEKDAHWIENLLLDINAGRPLMPHRISEGLTLRLAALRAALAKAKGAA